jgi:hypothetical protein
MIDYIQSSKCITGGRLKFGNIFKETHKETQIDVPPEAKY